MLKISILQNLAETKKLENHFHCRSSSKTHVQNKAYFILMCPIIFFPRKTFINDGSSSPLNPIVQSYTAFTVNNMNHWNKIILSHGQNKWNFCQVIKIWICIEMGRRHWKVYGVFEHKTYCESSICPGHGLLSISTWNIPQSKDM
jgi:hypothetical protein